MLKLSNRVNSTSHCTKQKSGFPGRRSRFLRGAALIVSALFLLCAAACTQSTTNNSTVNAPGESPGAETAHTQAEAPQSTQGAENTVMVQVGITQFTSHPSLDNCREGFIEGMKQGGYEEGINVKYIYQDAQTDMSLTNSIATKFVSDKVDLICAIATPSALAVATAIENTNIPLVFNAVSEPVDAGLIDSFEQPGGNITGVSDKLPVAKQLQLIRDMLPEAKKIGILYTTSEINAESQMKQFTEQAPEFGLEVVAVGISASNEIASALDSMTNKVDCIQNLTDNTVVAALPLVLDRAEKAGIPVFGSEEEQVVNGCLASEGIDYIQLGIQCGLQAAKILDGSAASAVPVETIRESRLTVNQSALALYGITLPPALEERASLVG